MCGCELCACAHEWICDVCGVSMRACVDVSVMHRHAHVDVWIWWGKMCGRMDNSVMRMCACLDVCCAHVPHRGKVFSNHKVALVGAAFPFSYKEMEEPETRHSYINPPSCPGDRRIA